MVGGVIGSMVVESFGLTYHGVVGHIAVSVIGACLLIGFGRLLSK
ncbi:MAG: GlsB/YeaQ/YmgE family stress response membrane protein [bacterium]